MAVRGCSAFGGAQNTAPPGSTPAPAGDRGPEPGLCRENGSGPAGGAASPPPKPQRRGAGPPSHRGRGWSLAARVRWPGPRGVLISGDFFSRAAKTPAALQARVCRPWLFPSPLSPAAAGQFLGSKSLLQGFQISAGRPPPPGSLTGLPQGSGGRSAPGSASVRPTSCVGLSLRMGALLPHRDSSPLSPQANAPLLPAHR